jgi:arylsulfate sulfotransferase
MSVTLAGSAPSPLPLATGVNWSPQAGSANPGTLWYRYRVRSVDGDFQMIRDFGPEANLAWTASEHEGMYEMEVTVRNLGTGEWAADTSLVQVTALAAGAPVITPTASPLVFLYSAPACPSGSRMRVQFVDPGGNIQRTPYKPCDGNRTMNFYLAGMLANTQYTVNHTLDTGSAAQDGPVLTLVSGHLPAMTGYTVMKPPVATIAGVLLQSTTYEPPVATDLNGNLLWFYTDYITLTRPEGNGRFLGVFQDATKDTSHQIVREFDVAGNTLLETNAARINEQLAALGKAQINSFHHEARRLPGGNILVLAAEERILTDVQGPGPVDVIGDMILVLDRDLQVVWAWDAFDHLDPYRLATLGETCGPGGGGCPPLYLATRANDWLHGNALQLTSDGNILYSMRHQDWLIKIDYGNGSGSGNVLWKLGRDGDFTFISSDPYPWTSHQHDANFEAVDATLLDVFDNGNVRRAADPAANSRGQVIRLDEQNRVATLVVNADLGAYSFALGSAHRLPNGDYHFDLGWVPDSGGAVTSQSVEVDSSGAIVYQIQAATPAYRSFRMQSLYGQ